MLRSRLAEFAHDFEQLHRAEIGRVVFDGGHVAMRVGFETGGTKARVKRVWATGSGPRTRGRWGRWVTCRRELRRVDDMEVKGSMRLKERRALFD